MVIIDGQERHPDLPVTTAVSGLKPGVVYE
jgi:hypothetical protein